MTYYVLGVKKNQQGVITDLRIAPLNGNTLGQSITRTEMEVIQLMQNGHAFVTSEWAYHNGSGWMRGADIQIVNGTHRKYLRSHKDGTPNDNLDNLLRFDWV